jgi:hypothetical protein
VKDQYVGDVNDYLKYALLRAVAAPPLRLAVIWMLTPSDGRSDGQRIRYLSSARLFRDLDPVLFDVLAGVVARGDRTVRAIEAANLFPGGIFVSDVVPDARAGRHRYFALALAAAATADILFFDPDNGFEVRSVPPGRRNSSKYLTWNEAAAAHRAGHSVIVYQHFPRRARQPFLRDLADRAQDRTRCHRVVAIQTSHTAFVILLQQEHEAGILDRLSGFLVDAAPFTGDLFDSAAG